MIVLLVPAAKNFVVRRSGRRRSIYNYILPELSAKNKRGSCKILVSGAAVHPLQRKTRFFTEIFQKDWTIR